MTRSFSHAHLQHLYRLAGLLDWKAKQGAVTPNFFPSTRSSSQRRCSPSAGSLNNDFLCSVIDLPNSIDPPTPQPPPFPGAETNERKEKVQVVVCQRSCSPANKELQAAGIIFCHTDAFGELESASAQNASSLHRKPRKQICAANIGSIPNLI